MQEIFDQLRESVQKKTHEGHTQQEKGGRGVLVPLSCLQSMVGVCLLQKIADCDQSCDHEHRLDCAEAHLLLNGSLLGGSLVEHG